MRRRGPAWRSFAAVLLLILVVAAPSASAQKRDKDSAPLLPLGLLGDEAREGEAAPDGPPPSGAAASGRGPAWTAAGLAAFAAGALVLLALSLVAARRARRPKVRGPAKRSFAAGRASGRAVLFASEAQAVEALRAPRVGRFGAYERTALGARVAMKRRRSEPCELMAGYLTGVFENAWAADVVVHHAGCGAKGRYTTCVYDIRRAATRAAEEPTPDVGRTEEGATRRSGGAERRSLPARRGVG